MNLDNTETNVLVGRTVSQEHSGRTPNPGGREPGRLRPSVGQILRHATEQLYRAGIESARLDAEWLLMAAVGWGKEKVYRNFQCKLDDDQQLQFESFVARRCLGEPAAYIVGEREFWSLDFKVNRDVLVPRPETEHLVETALRFLDSWTGPMRILELGTGSGAVAVSLAHERRDIKIWATDVSVDALRVARDNARQHGLAGQIHFLEGDLFEGLGSMKGPFTAILSNPPYIASGDLANLAQGVREWEPAFALDGGPDGMDFHRRIISEGPHYLTPGGMLALEIGSHTAADVCELFRIRNRFSPATVVHDYAGHERVVYGSLEDACG